MRIAILDDDEFQFNLVVPHLERAGYECNTFVSGQALIEALQTDVYSLLILDWAVPDVDGITVLRWVRTHLNKRLPVLFATAYDAENRVVEALREGADDYLIKPIRIPELLLRIEALLRHAQPVEIPKELVYGNYRFDPGQFTVAFDGLEGQQSVHLRRKEFELALLLFSHIGQVLDRGLISRSVWKSSANLTSRTIDTHLYRLRAKLQIRPENGWNLSTVQGQGILLELASSRLI